MKYLILILFLVSMTGIGYEFWSTRSLSASASLSGSEPAVLDATIGPVRDGTIRPSTSYRAGSLPAVLRPLPSSEDVVVDPKEMVEVPSSPSPTVSPEPKEMQGYIISDLGPSLYFADFPTPVEVLTTPPVARIPQPPAVPEPSTLPLAVFALLVLYCAKRK